MVLPHRLSFYPRSTMSRSSNVNPDHYKVAGRNRQGEDIEPELEKHKFARGMKRLRRRKPSKA